MNPDKLEVNQFYLLSRQNLWDTGNSVEIVQYEGPIAIDSIGKVKDFSRIKPDDDLVYRFIYLAQSTEGIWLDLGLVRNSVYPIEAHLLRYINLFL